MNARSLSSARISPSLERSVVIGLALALALGAAAQPRDGLTNSLGIQLISIPAGEFSMGQAQGGDWDEEPVHAVTISRRFYLSETEVTLDQYRQFRPGHSISVSGKATGVSWYEAMAFCEWLARKEGKPYRLPTEAEWEYACRAGTTTPFWSGNSPPSDGQAPNPWGLRAMHDPVMEWCLDWYGPYSVGPQVDPVGCVRGMVKVVRGDKPDNSERIGGEKNRAPSDYKRSANRAGMPPGFGPPSASVSATAAPGAHGIGFRIVQASWPTTAPSPAIVPFVRQCIKPVKQVKQAPPAQKPCFRKRYLLPIPPDNSPDDEIAAAGLPRAFRNHNHSPALEICPNGDVLVIMYTSYHEYEPGVSLMAARLRFGADQWDMPEPMFDFPDANDHAPMLWTDWQREGRMYFFWGSPQLARGGFPFQWLTSDDSAASWSEVHFPNFLGAIGPHSRQPINTALRDRAGTLYVASDAKGGSSVLWATSDEGKTWFDTGGRSAGRHTSYCLLKDGRILAMGGKNSEIDGYMPRATSSDSGKNWSVTKSPFPALANNQRPSLLRLQSGRLFFAGDFQSRDGKQPKDIRQSGSYVALSDDEGESWHIKRISVAQPHETDHKAPTLGYSAARQAPNGLIHLITSMNTPCLHFEFNEAWILSDCDAMATDADLMPPRTKSIARVEKYREAHSNGATKATWSAGVGDDGRYLLHGRETWFFEDQTKHYEADYNLGRKAGTETLWRRGGAIEWQWMHNADGTSQWTQYWDNGSKKAESKWRNFHADGPAKLWDRQGQLLSQVNFANGVKQ